MLECTTVTGGLDVHARSIRLAAVRADELLEERTLPYDEERCVRSEPAQALSLAVRRRGLWAAPLSPPSGCLVALDILGDGAGTCSLAQPRRSEVNPWP